MKIEVNEDSIRIIQAANNTIEGIVDHIKQNLQVLTNQQLNDLLTEITREVDTIE